MNMSSKETNYKELFANMTLAKLMKWEKEHESDWDKDDPKWSMAHEHALMTAGRKEFPKMNLMQLIEFYGPLEGGNLSILCIEWMLEQEPIRSLNEMIDEQRQHIDKIEKSLKVLLKETEAEQIPHDKRANITPAQLSRLKGGL